MNLQVRLAEQLSFQHTQSSFSIDHLFIPSFQLTYTKKSHDLRAKISFRSVQPNVADMTATTYRENKYMLRTGNPNLKNARKIDGRITYSWRIKQLTLIPEILYEQQNHPLYDKIEYASTENTFITRKENGDISTSQQYTLMAEYEIIPQRFGVGIAGAYAHIKSSLWEEILDDTFGYGIFVQFMYKGLLINANYVYLHAYLKQETGIRYSRRTHVNFYIGYNLNNWNFILSGYNPFFKGAYQSLLDQNGYTQRQHVCMPGIDSGQIFGVSVNYRFSFGNKKHKFHEEESE